MTTLTSTPILVAVAWPYANGDLHAGHFAGCLLPADIFGRFHRLRGNDVLYISGSDAHGTPITLEAAKTAKRPEEVFLHFHGRFLQTLYDLNLNFDLFTHTHTANHQEVAQTIFRSLYENGYIFAAPQRLLYSTRDERFLPDRYVEGTCPHCGDSDARGDQCEACGAVLNGVELLEPRHAGDPPGQLVPQLEIRETEHLFLDLPALATQLKHYLDTETTHWRANVRNFTRTFVANGLKPRPISRDLDWGIPVPLSGWEEKKLYIWFENIIGYLSASIEWARLSGDPTAWERWWYTPEGRSYYFLGKDNIPFHTIFWPAELLGTGRYPTSRAAATLNLPYDVPANEYLSVEKRALSKSRRWAVWLPDLVERYDVDAIRYNFAATLPETRDGDFTWEAFVKRNNGELVAKWGNLAYRVLSFAYKHWHGVIPTPGPLTHADNALLAAIESGFAQVTTLLDAVQIRPALQEILRLAGEVNGYLDRAPWFGVIKHDKATAATTVYVALKAIDTLNTLLAPYLPNSSQAIREQLGYNGQLFGRKFIESVGDENDRHDVLRYERNGAAGSWLPSSLPPGQQLQHPHPLFQRFDESIIAEEKARLATLNH